MHKFFQRPSPVRDPCVYLEVDGIHSPDLFLPAVSRRVHRLSMHASDGSHDSVNALQ